MIKIISKEKCLNVIDMHKKVNDIKIGSESIQKKPFDKLQNRLTDKMIPLATIRLILEPINILEMEKIALIELLLMMLKEVLSIKADILQIMILTLKAIQLAVLEIILLIFPELVLNV